jgi:hypothetical protein
MHILEPTENQFNGSTYNLTKLKNAEDRKNMIFVDILYKI